MAEPLTFFIDRPLGRGVGEDLRAAGLRVELHDDHFAQDTQDVDWVPEVTARGWMIITRDKAIRRKRHERQALLDAGARAFFLTDGNAAREEMRAVLLAARAEVERLAREQPPPFLATVNVRLGVQLLEMRAQPQQPPPQSPPE